MTLGELIDRLEKEDRNKVLPIGFGAPDSYRGYYERVAFEPAKNVTIGEMLKHAKSAVGATFTGYKGGKYTMDKNTICHIADYGECGDEIGELLIELLLNQETK